MFAGCEDLFTTEITQSTTLVIIQPDTSSGLVKEESNPQITFYGSVINYKTNQRESGVMVQIVGTDTPSGNTTNYNKKMIFYDKLAQKESYGFSETKPSM